MFDLTSKITKPAFAFVAALVMATGCASNGGDEPDKHAAHGSGVMCPTCETVWIREEHSAGTKGVRYMQTDKKMMCPDCDAMAKSHLMEDGKIMLHDCPTCKATPQPITPGPVPSSPRGTH